jgi:hypothetical protein
MFQAWQAVMTCQVLFMYVAMVGGWVAGRASLTFGYQYLWPPKYFIPRSLPFSLIMDIIQVLILLMAPLSQNYYVKN